MNELSSFDPASRDAQDITRHIDSVGAGRVVFFADGEVTLCEPIQDKIRGRIQDRNPQRYKLQKRVDKRWVDVSKYRTVSTGATAFEALKEGDFGAANSIPLEDVKRAAALDSGLLHFSLKRVLGGFTTGNEASRDPEKVKAALDFLDALGEVHDDERIRYARAIVDLFNPLLGMKFKTKPSSMEVSEVLASVRQRVNLDPSRYESPEAKVAVSLMLGKLSSINNRTVAARHFAEVRVQDTTGLIDYFYTDMGAMTYFSETDLDPGAKNRAREITDSIVSVDRRSSGNEIGVLISVDPHFFRIYSPRITFLAQQMPNVDYNLLICASEQETDELIGLTDDYLSSLSKLNRGGFPSNINYLRVPVPGFVVDPKTFFASARFFAAEAMLDQYSNIYVMDADLDADIDPRPFLENIRDATFSSPVSKDFNYLSPWRRNLAGNLALNQQVLQTNVLEDIQTYLADGLSRPFSWMLDQNALAYAIERNSSYWTSLGSRPFRQPKFRSSWEKSYWKSLKSGD